MTFDATAHLQRPRDILDEIGRGDHRSSNESGRATKGTTDSLETGFWQHTAC